MAGDEIAGRMLLSNCAGDENSISRPSSFLLCLCLVQSFTMMMIVNIMKMDGIDTDKLITSSSVEIK